MIEKLIGWFGKAFMAGSGYEKRLHDEMIRLKNEVTTTNQILEAIKSELINIKNHLEKKN